MGCARPKWCFSICGFWCQDTVWPFGLVIPFSCIDLLMLAMNVFSESWAVVLIGISYSWTIPAIGPAMAVCVRIQYWVDEMILRVPQRWSSPQAIRQALSLVPGLVGSRNLESSAVGRGSRDHGQRLLSFEEWIPSICKMYRSIVAIPVKLSLGVYMKRSRIEMVERLRDLCSIQVRHLDCS